eukprot:8638073-Alexandrium_andersonii.AAC.1
MECLRQDVWEVCQHTPRQCAGHYNGDGPKRWFFKTNAAHREYLMCLLLYADLSRHGHAAVPHLALVG